MKKVLVTMAMMGALVTGAAQADLVEYDWKDDGDGLVSYDTETGNLWLDLTVTGGMSINQAQEAIDSGVLEGWRLPAEVEMRALADSLFATVAAVGSVNGGATTDEETDAHAIMGQNVTGYTYGLYNKDGSSMLFGSREDKVFYNYKWRSDLDFSRSFEGVYLVSTDLNVSMDVNLISQSSDVPVPGLAFGSVALALMVFRKRKIALEVQR